MVFVNNKVFAKVWKTDVKEKYTDLQKDYILLTQKQTFTATENEDEDEEKSTELEDIINEVIGGK